MSRFLRIGLAVLVLAAGTALAAQDILDESDVGRPVKAVRFVCDSRFDERVLARLVPLRVGDPLTQADVDETRRRLELKGVWSTVEIETSPSGDGIEVVITLVSRILISDIELRGNENVSSTEILRRLRLTAGTPLETETLDAAAGRVRDLYTRKGFDKVEVKIERVPQKDHLVDLVFVIDEGVPLTVASVEVDVGGVLSQKEVEKDVDISPGTRLERDMVRQVRTRVGRAYRHRSYYGADVGARWERIGDSQAGVLHVTVEPGPPYDVVFKGNKVFDDDDLLELIELDRRLVVTDGTWRELSRRIRNAYQERGYYFAKVSLEIGNDIPKRIAFTIDEGRKMAIRSIDFAGNSVAAAKLRAVMRTAPSGWWPFGDAGVLRDDVLADDLRNIWFLYRRLGFESAEVVDSRVDFDRKRGTIRLTIEVDEGRRSFVAKVVTDSIGDVPLPPLKTRVGEPYNPEALQGDREALTAALMKRGYADAAVESKVSSVRGASGVEVTVEFDATPGPEQHVGLVIVQNNELTLDRVILREVVFRPGDPYDPQELSAAQGRLYDLGLFRRVSVRKLDAKDLGVAKDDAVVGVDVDERSPGSMQFGVGYDTARGFRGFGELGYDNVGGMARRAVARGEVSLDPSSGTLNEYLGTLGFVDPRVLDSRLTLRNTLLAQRRERELNPFGIERFGVTLDLDRTWARRFTVGGEFQFEQDDVFDVPPDVLTDPRLAGVKDEGFLRIITVGPYLTYDGRDDAFSPTRGIFDSLRIAYAGPGLGADVQFVKIIAHHSHIIPLTNYLAFVYALRASWARELDGKTTVPIQERFFLGGRTTVRGFDENAVGPKGSMGSPLGGDLALNTNVELRFPLLFGFGGAVFVDGGGDYLQNDSISIHDFRRSAGLGVRYDTPVGPISLEYGFKLDPRGGESIGAVHFTIGVIF